MSASAVSPYFDALETQSQDQRETAFFQAFSEHLANTQQKVPAWKERLAGVEPTSVNDRASLASLPVTRKSELVDRQKSTPPFGGLTPKDAGSMAQIFTSPGPIFEPEADRPDYWQAGRAFYAAGFRPGEIVHNSFAYHLTPGGWIMHSGARACGCAVFPAGVGNTEQQIEAIDHLKPAGYAGVPDFLKVLLDKGQEMGRDMSSLTKAVVSGAALPPSLRQEFSDRGIAVVQAYATADLGVIAYESSAESGLICSENVIVEIVRPGSGDPVPEGEVGEVVVTTLNPDYPLIRFATGDLSAVLTGQSPCGRTNMRLKGWMGRADQTTKVKGMFVTPTQMTDILSRHAPVQKLRLIVERDAQQDVMTLHCETDSPSDSLKAALEESLKAVCKMKGDVVLAAPQSLANDGKVIDDQRTYE